MKFFKIKTFVLLAFFVFFSSCNVLAAEGDSGSITNVVELTEEQYNEIISSYDKIQEAISNIVVFVEQNSDGNQDLLAVLDQFKKVYVESGNNALKKFLYSNYVLDQSTGRYYFEGFHRIPFNEIFNSMTYMIGQLGEVFHIYVSGDAHGAYDFRSYNFIELFKLVEELKTNFLDLHDKLVGPNGYLEGYMDQLTELDDSLQLIHGRCREIRDLITSMETDLLSFFADVRHWSGVQTNQINTIIHIISNRQDNATNDYQVISNLLDHISSDLGYIRDNWSDVSAGGGGGGVPGGGSGDVDLSMFDNFIKNWVDRYFYPEDSIYSIAKDGNKIYPISQYWFWMSRKRWAFRVPFFYSSRMADLLDGSFASFADPEWTEAFQNTIAAYNDGHTNFYDITSALLTDSLSLQAQHYGLFYILATNILLQSGEADTQEIEDDLATLQDDSNDVTYSLNDFKDQIAESLGGLEDKYSEFETKFKDITSYLGSIPRLPANDYHFNLPNFEFLGTEHGGMEIVLPLTDPAFVSVIEVLHNFFIIFWWTATFLGLIALGRAVYRMFVFLFKVFVFLGSIGSD